MFTTAELFGKFHSPLRHAAAPLRGCPLHHLESLLVDRLDPKLLAPNSTSTNSRQRLYTPKLSFLSFLGQTLSPNSSCREAVRQIQAYYQGLPHPKHLDENTSGYCQARGRWSLGELVEIRSHLVRGSARNPLTLGLPTLRPLKLVDGTCLNLPDTPANRQSYPQSQDQQPECGFPLLRLVAVFSLESGAVLERQYSPYTISENALYQRLWPTFQKDDIILGDRNFGSWSPLASLQPRGIDGIFQLHASRNQDFRRGQRLGLHDRLIRWAKPRNKPANLTPEQWQALPASLTVRLVRFRLPSARGRGKKIVLVTTLLDPIRWPRELLAALYARRWQIELYLDDIKTTLQMERLSCLSPAMVHKELEMHLIAYNLIRSLMGEAALACHVPLERLSFKGTLDAARQYSLVLAQIPLRHRHRRQTLYAAMLAVIAADQVPERPGRFEPRCQKRRPKRYPFMKRPRRELRAARKNHLPARKKRRA